MNWTALITSEIESTYRTTRGLLDLVDDDTLNWKPATGSNWMTTAQLLKHLTNACGEAIKGFVTGDWGLPEGMDVKDIPPEDMLRPAEKLPAIASVAEAKRLLESDRLCALDMLKNAGEERLATEQVAAPWNPAKLQLGFQLLLMVKHLNQHKAQLFFYLKLQGKPVHTGHLWGM